DPVEATDGLKIVPNYTFANAPAPKVIVIPAQRGQSEAMLRWIRTASGAADITMSVCVGANILASTGLLSGRAATTHHNSYRSFAAAFPDIELKRGVRFVEDGKFATSGGLSSGIDLALRVVSRYFGDESAKRTAYYMEYLGEGWRHPESNKVYAQRPVSTPAHPLCAVCDMEVNLKTAPKLEYAGKTYYFCSDDHKRDFEQNPKAFI
ncbi:MAG: YHS domain-containing protein, partial [Acidobacteria bacterium]|nr:YHS domain-containing protein [Acidobacteriota bacterium]